MGFLKDYCYFLRLRDMQGEPLYKFSCGNDDLDEFFHKDYLPYEDELMGKSYCYGIKENDSFRIVAAFTVSNHSIRNRLLSSGAKKLLQENVSQEKRNIDFPAVLIGRIGVDVEFQDKHIGSELMDFIKAWFVDSDNKTGCRFILVDAYNNPATINYYKANGFRYLFNNIDSEKKYRKLEGVEGDLHTRTMIFDLYPIKR